MKTPPRAPWTLAVVTTALAFSIAGCGGSSPSTPQTADTSASNVSFSPYTRVDFLALASDVQAYWKAGPGQFGADGYAPRP